MAPTNNENYKINESQKNNCDHLYFSKPFCPRILLDIALAGTVNLEFCAGLELGTDTSRRHLLGSRALSCFSTTLFKSSKYVITIVPHNDHVCNEFPKLSLDNFPCNMRCAFPGLSVLDIASPSSETNTPTFPHTETRRAHVNVDLGTAADVSKVVG
jgi:hypothetical protein